MIRNPTKMLEQKGGVWKWNFTEEGDNQRSTADQLATSDSAMPEPNFGMVPGQTC